MTLAITGAVVVHGGLTWLGLPGWQCPIRQYLGVPCLGCGLSRAMLALLGGDWSTALRYHAFAPLFLAALLLIALTACLPQQARQQVSRWVAQVERRTGLTGLLLVGLVFYWLVRLLFFYDSFVGLIMG